MLEELIDWLKQQDPNLTVPHGFGSPHSYRGNYTEVAFSPEVNVTFGEMLQHAESALGATFEGWKGGEFTMSEWSTCWIADEGSCVSDRIGPTIKALWKVTAK